MNQNKFGEEMRRQHQDGFYDKTLQGFDNRELNQDYEERQAWTVVELNLHFLSDSPLWFGPRCYVVIEGLIRKTFIRAVTAANEI